MQSGTYCSGQAVPASLHFQELCDRRPWKHVGNVCFFRKEEILSCHFQKKVPKRFWIPLQRGNVLAGLRFITIIIYSGFVGYEHQEWWFHMNIWNCTGFSVKVVFSTDWTEDGDTEMKKFSVCFSVSSNLGVLMKNVSLYFTQMSLLIILPLFFNVTWVLSTSVIFYLLHKKSYLYFTVKQYS